MQTEVIMERKMFGMPIAQKSKSEFFSATDLVKAGNKWRLLHDKPIFNLSQWLKTKTTKEFIESLEQEFGKVIESRGRGSRIWVHPFLFIDAALAISPKLKIEAYKWLYDQLLKARNNSGDSYKKMCGTLYIRHHNKRDFSMFITKIASEIKRTCGVMSWETATEEQLSKRDRLHHNISLLANVFNNNDEAVRQALLQEK